MKQQAYRGFGKCTECGEPTGRIRGKRCVVDRCKGCGAEWECRDHTRDWQRRK